MLDSKTSTATNAEAPETKKCYVTKTVFAPMMPLGEWKQLTVEVGKRTKTKSAGFFSKETVEVEVPVYEERKEWVPNGKYSDCRIDHDAMARMTEEAMNELAEEGYEVLSVTPWNEGNYHWGKYSTGAINNPAPSTCYSYGYSFTRGMMISARLREMLIKPG